MSQDYIDYDEIERASYEACEDLTPLDQLKFYQLVNRKFAPLLEAYEVAVLSQILDRTIGWRKRKAIFTAQRLYEGDTVYGGLERTMHRSKMMSALKRLVACGLVKREIVTRGMVAKAYSINFEIDIEELRLLAPTKRKSYKRGPSIYPSNTDVEHNDAKNDAAKHVANKDKPVPQMHLSVSIEDINNANEDPREGYQKKHISIKNTIRIARTVPAEPTSQDEINFFEDNETAQNEKISKFKSPPPRKRSPSRP